MRQGLIAQWHRGIAIRGLVGAMLLMIPVLVGATIGFGGVAGGLNSLATGPSETAFGTTSAKTGGEEGRAHDIESLSASLTTTLDQRVTPKRPVGAERHAKPRAAPVASSVSGGTPTQPSSSSGSGSGSAPVVTAGSGATTLIPPSTSETTEPVTSGQTNIITDLLNILLNPPK